MSTGEPRKLTPQELGSLQDHVNEGRGLGLEEQRALMSLVRDLQRYWPPQPNANTYLRQGTKNPRNVYMHPGDDFSHPGAYVGTMASDELSAWVCRALNWMNGRVVHQPFTEEQDG